MKENIVLIYSVNDFSTRVPRIYNGERRFVEEKTGYLFMKECNWSLSYPMHKKTTEYMD
jgi:hypothetical protein